MNPTLEVIDPAGQVARTPLETPRTAVDAAPGHVYRIAGGQAGPSPRVTRVDDDLVVEGLPEGRELVIAGFFVECRPGDVCTLSLTGFPGMRDASITPATLPLAALPDGTFVLFTAGGAVAGETGNAAGTPANAPVASAVSANTGFFDLDSSLPWKPILGIGAGVVVAGAAISGGGSSVGSDPAIPAPVIATADTPELADGINQREAAQGFAVNGTGAPGTSVTVTLAGSGYSQSVTTPVAADGTWQVVLAGGSLPTADGTYALTAVATDAAGVVSQPTAAVDIVVDTTPPAAIATVVTGTDNAPSTPAPLPVGLNAGTGAIVAGSSTNDTTPTLNGTVSQALAAGETIEVLRNGQTVGTATVTGNGFAFTEAAPLPDGQVSYTVVVRDAAGNAAPASDSFLFTVDTEAPLGVAGVTGVISDVRGASGIVPDQGSTSDTTPTLFIRNDDVLEPGSTLLVLRTTGGVTSVIATRDAASNDNTPIILDDPLTVGTSVSYSTQVVDSAGNLSASSAPYSILIVPPPDPIA